jgi:GH15 family glucan-1,4-alpha-glucosidase
VLHTEPVNRIQDYAIIGDCRSAALVGIDGSIDWACFPRFDSPAVFAKILDAERGGAFAVTPEAVEATTRAYEADTNVLVTTFTCAEGTLELTDCMPIGSHAILRRLRCTSGVVAVETSISPRFEYASFVPRFRLTSEETAEIVGGADAIWVTATRSLEDEHERIRAWWRLRAGENIWIEAAWSPSTEMREPDPRRDFQSELDATIAFWRGWMKQCWYNGDYADAVRRSALVLKALTYAPTGAVVAAPTTSLPERIGGVRNWDYRYTWIRDATLTLISLFVLGFRDEADAFKLWLERTGAGHPEDLQIMYGIVGRRSLPELELEHLAGHRESVPVRIGNGAVKQLQLDSYGQILQAAYLYGKAGGTITADNWFYLSGLVDICCDRWRMPDNGIWEIRDEPRHFVHSKLNCWVALDRAIRIAVARHLPAPIERWTKERDELHTALIGEAERAGWFTQAFGTDAADASVLLVPAMGLVPTLHPSSIATIERVRKELERDGLVHRYVAADGLEGGEGAFLLCSFWLLDCLTHAGRLDEADALLEKLLSLQSDVGLYAEEVDPATGEHLGNFPQAFTHMALVTSCAHLSAAKRGLLPPPDEPHDYAELALDRLLGAGHRFD